jgi:lipopolysaccharide/colanic/teichoic acid biosynthesis glycosyltransferase
MIKLIFDYIIILIFIPIIIILIIFISLFILFFMGRPIFYLQERVGLNNKVFKIIKFRTMNNIDVSTLNYIDTSIDMQRITVLGKFLRSTSLDELPEIINVLKRDMSLVGPRPLLKEYLELYSKRQLQRHNILPGITGLAQIRGRNTINWEKRFNLDLIYIKKQGIFFDLKIIIVTLMHIITRKNMRSKKNMISDKFKKK